MNPDLFPLTTGLVALATLACQAPSRDVEVQGLEVFSLRGGAGLAVLHSSRQDDQSFEGSLDGEDVAFALGFGYRALPFLSIESAYSNLGELEFNGTFNGASSAGTLETTGTQATVLGHWPVGNGFELLGEVGLFAWQSEERERLGGASDDDAFEGVDPLIGLGLQAVLAEALAARLSWTHYFDLNEDGADVLLLQLLYFL